jgi:hypothetical protein
MKNSLVGVMDVFLKLRLPKLEYITVDWVYDHLDHDGENLLVYYKIVPKKDVWCCSTCGNYRLYNTLSALFRRFNLVNFRLFSIYNHEEYERTEDYEDSDCVTIYNQIFSESFMEELDKVEKITVKGSYRSVGGSFDVKKVNGFIINDLRDNDTEIGIKLFATNIKIDDWDKEYEPTLADFNEKILYEDRDIATENIRELFPIHDFLRSTDIVYTDIFFYD